MTAVVMVPIPVDADAAEILKDDGEVRRMGRLVSELARLRSGRDPLVAVFDEIAAAAAADGFTEADLEAELAAHKAERTR